MLLCHEETAVWRTAIASVPFILITPSPITPRKKKLLVAKAKYQFTVSLSHIEVAMTTNMHILPPCTYSKIQILRHTQEHTHWTIRPILNKNIQLSIQDVLLLLPLYFQTVDNSLYIRFYGLKDNSISNDFHIIQNILLLWSLLLFVKVTLMTCLKLC